MKWIFKAIDIILSPVTVTFSLFIVGWFLIAEGILAIRYKINHFIRFYIVAKQDQNVAYWFYNLVQVIFFIILLPTYILGYAIRTADITGQVEKKLKEKVLSKGSKF